MFLKFFKKFFSWLIIIFFIIVIVWLYIADFSQGKNIEFGVTYSSKYAKEFNINQQKLLLALLDDLKIRKFRLVAYWDEIERLPDKYDFASLDWQLSEIEKRHGQVILAIGQRLPRWPECHWPKWAMSLTETERQQRILKLFNKIIDHFKNNQTIIAWQIENEPFLEVFGECPKLNSGFLKEEVAYVRSLDSRPIVITESGEVSTWLRAAKLADYVGTSIYRITWNKYFGYFYYPLPPSHYYLKAKIVEFFTNVKNVYVSEMQAEPWSGKPMPQTPLAEQYRSMDVERFKKNLNYVKKTGLSPIYLWGAEWWYWLKEQGDPTIWNEAKKIWSGSEEPVVIDQDLNQLREQIFPKTKR